MTACAELVKVRKESKNVKIEAADYLSQNENVGKSGSPAENSTLTTLDRKPPVSVANSLSAFLTENLDDLSLSSLDKEPK